MSGFVLKTIFSWFQILRFLSFDVCLGAVAGGVYAETVLDTHLGIAYYGILFLAVFFIYSLDHLVDALRIGKNASRYRYRFHFQYSRIILVFTLLSGVVAFFLSIGFMPMNVILGGLIVFVGVMIHLLLAQYTRSMPFMKEISVALYYTIGIWFAPVLTGKNHPIQWIVILLFYLTVLVSLFIFSWMEIEEDAKDKSHSIAVFLGRKKTDFLIKIVFVISYMLNIYIFFNTERTYSKLQIGVSPALVLLVHTVIFVFPSYFSQKDRFRILGDGIFVIYCLPLFL